MQIITTISDWNKNNFYLAQIKGKIYKQIQNVSVIDISNNTEKYNNTEAAFILKNTYKSFPDNTIHLIFINTIVEKNTNYLLIKYDNHFFIGADNGIFSLIFDKEPQKIINLPHTATTFPELEIMAYNAIKLINSNLDLSQIGNEIAEYQKRKISEHVLEDNLLILKIIYFDTYNNAILNINKEYFNEIIGKNNFEIIVSSINNKITKISENYYDVNDFELFAIFNKSNYLEIGIIKGDIKQLFGLDINNEILIKFGNNLINSDIIQLK